MRMQQGKFKVLHIIHGFGTGGAETWLVSMMKKLKDFGAGKLEMHFLATGGGKLTYDDDVLAFGGVIHYLPFNARSIMSFRKKLVRLLRSERFDAIHDHQDFISGVHFLLMIGNLPKVRVSYLHNPKTFIENYLNSPGRFLTFHLGRFLMCWLSTHITGTSEQVMDDYGYNKWPFKFKRIPAKYCGISTEEFRFSESRRMQVREGLGISESSRVYLFAGRIGLDDFPGAINQKNPEFAFALAKSIVHKEKDSIFLFAGLKGHLGAEMEREVSEVGLSGRIRFLGVRKDISDLMSASDLFIFPSHMEGLGMVLVEAQASGLFSFASSAVPREAEVIESSVQFIDLEDGVDAWSEVIMAKDKPDFGYRIEAQNIVKRSPFSITNSVKALLDMYGYKECDSL